MSDSGDKSAFQIGMAHFRAFAIFVSVVGLAVIAIVTASRQTIDQKIRTSCQDEFNKVLEKLGYHAEIGQAAFVEGEGFRLRDIKVGSRASFESGADHRQAQYLVFVDDVLLQTDATIADVITKNLKIDKIIIDRAEIKLARMPNGRWLIQDLIDQLKLQEQKKEFELVPVEFNECSVRVQQLGPDKSAYELDLNSQSVENFNSDVTQLTVVNQIQFADINGRFFRLSRSASSSTSESNIKSTSQNLVESDGQALNPSHRENGVGNTNSTPSRSEYDIWKLSLHAQGTHRGRFDCDFVIDLSSQQWDAKVFGFGWQFDRQWFELMNPRVSSQVERIDRVVGKVGFEGNVSSVGFAAIPKFRLSGNIYEAEIVDRQFAESISQISAGFELSNDELKIIDGKAKTGLGQASLNYVQKGFPMPESWTVDGELDQVNLHPGLKKILPEAGKKFWKDFSPTGTLDLRFRVSKNTNGISKTVFARLIDVSFQHHELPFRFESCAGQVDLQNDICSINIQALENGKIIEINGRFERPGPNATGWVDLNAASPIPITEKVVKSLEKFPNVERVVRDFRADGQFSAFARLRKDQPGQKFKLQYEIKLKDCSVKYRLFEYPFHNVNGSVVFDGGVTKFQDFTAINGDGAIRCNGKFDDNRGLDLRFVASNVQLDEQLRSALPKSYQLIWRDIKPKGIVDQIILNLVKKPNTKYPQISLDSSINTSPNRPSNVSIRPVWFPYEINQLAGQFDWNKGQLTARNVSGRHGRGWFRCQGIGRFTDEDWAVRFQDIRSGSIAVDPKLKFALPEVLSNSLEYTSFNGQVAATGEMAFEGIHQPADMTRKQLVQNSEPMQNYGGRPYRFPVQRVSFEEPVDQANSDRAVEGSDNNRSLLTKATWSVRIDTDAATASIGTPIEQIAGSATLQGIYENEQLRCRGELDLDSLVADGILVTNFRGPVWIDNERLALGTPAFVQSSGSSPRSVEAKMFGGTLSMDAQVEHGGQNRFTVKATLTDGDLNVAVNELSESNQKVSGRGFAAIQFNGNASGYHTLAGKGIVRLRQARIEVPVMEKLGEILRNKKLSTTVLDESNVEFSLRGQDLYLNRIEMIGNRLSLIGNGYTNLNKDIDLNFYTVAGRKSLEIPLITDLLKASSQQILHVKVSGTTDNPRTTKDVLPALSESFRAMQEDFRILAERNSQRR